jgi:hypothetical protein
MQPKSVKWNRMPAIALVAIMTIQCHTPPSNPSHAEEEAIRPSIGFDEPAIDLATHLPQGFINARAWDIPEALDFAGEAVDLRISDVYQRFDRELHVNTYWHNNTIMLIKRANQWLPVIEPILAQYGVPDDFKYLAMIESDLMNKVSPAKAVGYWQILEGTAKELGLEVSREVDERYDPWKSTEAACKYLLKAYEKFGNWTMVAAAYNRGMKGMQNAMEDQQESDYYKLLLNEETSRYLFRILAAKEIISQPGKYGFDIKEHHLYPPVNYKLLVVTEDIKDLVSFAKEQGVDYKTLKIYNPWLRSDKLNVRRNHTYTFRFPV